MKYQLKLNGMHCQGCSNLIKMTLEDEGFKNVTIDISTDKGSIEIETVEKTQVESKLNEAFAGLSGYSYEDLMEAAK